VSWIALAWGALTLTLALNARWPLRRPGALALACFLPGWIVGELPLHLLVVSAAGAGALAAAGALDELAGVVGIALTAVAWPVLLGVWREGRAVQAAILEVVPQAEGRSRTTLRRLLWPFTPERSGVQRLSSLPVAPELSKRLVADVFRPPGEAAGAPVLVFVHGGGWTLGFRRFQGLPLLYRLARAGWICVSVEYRLSPWVSFPEHVIDVKRAIAWVRERALGWGGDPERVAIAGNSAGGHLATLAALTPARRAWQPGFEAADTRVAACVSLYGVYDLLGRAEQWPHQGLQLLWERAVLKRRLGEDEAAFREASPWDHLTTSAGDEATPILVVHGDRDTVVPIGEARAFVDHARRVAPGRVTYLEVPGAQHAFEVFASPRSERVVEAIATWLEERLGRDDFVDAGAILSEGSGDGDQDRAGAPAPGQDPR